MAWLGKERPDLAEKITLGVPEKAEDPDFVIIDHDDDDEPAAGSQNSHNSQNPLTDARAVLTTHTLQKAVADQIYVAMKERNTEVLKVLLGIWRETGAKSFEIKAPTVNGTEEKIGLISLTIPSDKTVITDEDELLDWLEANRPDLVRYLHHEATPPVPAMPAWDEAIVSPAALPTLLKEGKVIGEDIMSADGEIIPGLRTIPAGEPKEFRVTFGGAGAPLKARAIDLLRDNEIAGASLKSIVPLPEIDH